MILSVALNWWSVRLARSYQSRRQLELFGAFMRAKWTFLVDRKAGEMTNAIVTECERLGRAFTLCLSLFGSAVVALIYLALSAFIAWQATLSLIGFAVVAALGDDALLQEELCGWRKALRRSTRNCSPRSRSNLPAPNSSRPASASIAPSRKSSLWCASLARSIRSPPPCRELVRGLARISSP